MGDVLCTQGRTVVGPPIKVAMYVVGQGIVLMHPHEFVIHCVCIWVLVRRLLALCNNARMYNILFNAHQDCVSH